ncbi:aspartyl-phosphate phosphatase Spo0E family protein [Proteiniborus sp.]|uniref:aspartyl-phosphate phosphatase Spo0E family protein n=1 Tax=Proteiniborus sp. TaxID=2079015 RepID=UPI00331AAC06
MCDCSTEDIKDIIESKQQELNKLLESETLDKAKALNLSVELDKLIYKYYSYIM